MKAFVAYNITRGEYMVLWPQSDYPVSGGPSLDEIAMKCDAQGIGFEYTGREDEDE